MWGSDSYASFGKKLAACSVSLFHYLFIRSWLSSGLSILCIPVYQVAEEDLSSNSTSGRIVTGSGCYSAAPTGIRVDCVDSYRKNETLNSKRCFNGFAELRCITIGPLLSLSLLPLSLMNPHPWSNMMLTYWRSPYVLCRCCLFCTFPKLFNQRVFYLGSPMEEALIKWSFRMHRDAR